MVSLRVGLAVLADSLKSSADGAALLPTLFIFSPDPALILALFLWIFSYSPLINISTLL